MTYVYILRSLEYLDRYYVGVTADLRSRLKTHNAGEVAHTSKYAPWAIKTYVAFSDEKQAIAFEKYLKSPSGRASRKSGFNVGAGTQTENWDTVDANAGSAPLSKERHIAPRVEEFGRNHPLVAGLAGLVENGVACDILTSGLAQVASSQDPAAECFDLTTDQARQAVGVLTRHHSAHCERLML